MPDYGKIKVHCVLLHQTAIKGFMRGRDENTHCENNSVKAFDGVPVIHR